MNSISPWLLADTSRSTSTRKHFLTWTWLSHITLAILYVVTVVTSLSVVYTGTRIAIAWPAVGIAVWWAVTCRSWRVFALVCAFIVFVPSFYLYVFNGSSFYRVTLIGISHFIAGPAIGPVMALSEKMHPTEPKTTPGRLFAPLAKIRIPRHVYRLLITSLVMVPIAKTFTILALVDSGADVSLDLYISLILRDITGIITVAAPGIVISSSIVRSIKAAAIQEFLVVVIITAIMMRLIFSYDQDLPLVYLAMLPLYWSATRLPVALAVMHAVLTSLMTVYLSLMMGTAPFALAADSLAQAANIQLFATLCILLSLVVSTTVQQHSALRAEYEVLTATIPDALLLVNREGDVFPVNSAAHRVVQELPDGKFVTRKLQDLEGEWLNEKNLPSARALQGEIVEGVLAQLAEPSAEELRTGQRVFMISGTPLYLVGETTPGHALLLYHDSTDEYRAMQQLKRAHDDARHLFEYAPQGVATLDGKGRIIQANGAFGELVGLPANQLPGRSLDDFSAEAGIMDEVTAVLRQPGALAHADRCINAEDGKSRRVALSFRTMAGEDATRGTLLLNAVDVTERQRLHELVSYLADHDALTGLVNKRRFEADFEKILDNSERRSSDGALLLIDLDNFKTVNDMLGHQAGDDVLREVAKLLQDCSGPDDVVGRLGGDEFVIILPGTDKSGATSMGTRIIETMHQRFAARRDVSHRVSASIGITMFSEAREQSMDPFLLADKLLYDAKRSGRNRFVALNAGSTVDQSGKPQMTLEHIQYVLESDALSLELQPIFETTTGKITFAEGLLRIAPEEAFITTYELVESVEKAGLGPQLDKIMLPKGIKLLSELQDVKPGFRLALNLSAQSLGSDEVCQVVLAALEKYQIAPGLLVLEVTESAPLPDVEAARAFQRTLKARGVTFALDDFGAGHDPYRYFRQLDFQILKIAGEFVEGMVTNSVDGSIVRSIIHLANEQGMDTVAEFVSNEKIFQAVQQTGITYTQGYHIGASLPLEDFIATHLTEN